MRLVVKYSIGDGFTWGAEVVVPVFYESAEAFLVDFEAAVKSDRARYQNRWRVEESIKMGGQHFCFADFFSEDGTYCPPTVMTVDDWFQSEGVES
jgi:hypothetical protein